MLRKAILKPLSLGMELRLVKKSLLTLFTEIGLSNSSLFDSHISSTLSILCSDVHELGEKTAYYYLL
jgi:hypothetical protein